MDSLSSPLAEWRGWYHRLLPVVGLLVRHVGCWDLLARRNTCQVATAFVDWSGLWPKTDREWTMFSSEFVDPLVLWSVAAAALACRVTQR